MIILNRFDLPHLEKVSTTKKKKICWTHLISKTFDYFAFLADDASNFLQMKKEKKNETSFLSLSFCCCLANSLKRLVSNNDITNSGK